MDRGGSVGHRVRRGRVRAVERAIASNACGLVARRA
jgi:hypothetical protein